MVKESGGLHSQLVMEVTAKYGPLNELSTGFNVTFFNPDLEQVVLQRNNVEVEYRIFKAITARRERTSRLSPRNKHAASYSLEYIRGGSDIRLSLDHTALKTGKFNMSIHGSIKKDNGVEESDIVHITYHDNKPFSIAYSSIEDPVTKASRFYDENSNLPKVDLYRSMYRILRSPQSNLQIPNLAKFVDGDVVDLVDGFFTKQTYDETTWLTRFFNDSLDYLIADIPTTVGKSDLQDAMVGTDWYELPLLSTAALYRQSLVNENS